MAFLNFSCIIIIEYTYSNTVKYASNEKTQGVEYRYGGFRGSVGMGILGFSVGMGWVWGLSPFIIG